jgi:hypothetical protein
MRKNSAMRGYQVMNLRIGSVAIILAGISAICFSNITLFPQILIFVSTLVLSVWFLIAAQKIAKINTVKRFH